MKRSRAPVADSTCFPLNSRSTLTIRRLPSGATEGRSEITPSIVNGVSEDFDRIDDRDISGDTHGCSANIPHTMKNRAAKSEKNPEYGRKHASSRHEKAARTIDTSQKYPPRAEITRPTAMNKKGIRNGQRCDMAVNYFLMEKEP